MQKSFTPSKFLLLIPQKFPIFLFFILIGSSVWVNIFQSTPPKTSLCKTITQSSLPAESVPKSSSLPPFVGKPPIFQPGSLDSRFGFGLSDSADPVYWGIELNAAWYLNWNIELTRNFIVPEHWQMVRLSPGCISPGLDYIRWAAVHYPGKVWIIGNEPDVIWQDSITPEEYALDYNILYQVIKNSDPTARIAVAGVSQGTPLRLAYLDRVLQAYQNNFKAAMPVDWWTLHGFVLREERDSWGVGIPPGFPDQNGQLYEISDHGSIQLFKQQIIAFRTWMKDRGYQNSPLAITEFGILMPPEYGYSPMIIQQYIRDTFQWLSEADDPLIGLPQDNLHLVQRWAWFSLADSQYSASDLAIINTHRLTPAGEAYRDFVRNVNQ
jgi:hypothetical protein